jgi:hypothetical protein
LGCGGDIQQERPRWVVRLQPGERLVYAGGHNRQIVVEIVPRNPHQGGPAIGLC